MEIKNPEKEITDLRMSRIFYQRQTDALPGTGTVSTKTQRDIEKKVF